MSDRSPASPAARAVSRSGGGALALLLAAGLAAPAPASAGTAAIVPEEVARIDISAAGGGARLLLGDVSGDGRRDLVMMQPTYSADDRYIGRQVQALTAYDLSGDLLWQIGEPDPRVTTNGTDIPAQIHDVDGDGRNEVVAVMNDRFTVFDGRTGEFVRDFALPDPEAHDAIAFADLRGLGEPRDILLKDRYERIWALDEHGEQLWTHHGNTGHYPWPYDLDGDGRHELMAGYDLLGPDGSVRWSADMADHADTMWFGDVDGDGGTNIVLGGAETVAHDPDGREVWRNDDTVESQNVILGDFRPDLPGLETLGLDRIDRGENGVDGLFLIDAQGEMLFREDRQTRGCWGSIPDRIHNWDGRHSDLIMAWNRGCGEPPSIFDGEGNVVTRFDVDGRLAHADLCGDDRPEVVDFVMGETAHVYANGGCDLDSHVTGTPLPQLKQQYNFTRYTAGEQPVDHAAGRERDRLRGTPGWRIDLGARREITGVVLSGSNHGGYRIATSTDGRAWTPLAEGRLTRRDGSAEHDVTAVGRHVRVVFDDPAAAARARIEVLGNR
ncbi:discoidin domain-containing protein [Marinactinospora rubrisoli]|uniref:Discoidin domain-containing protein n=1 Tax=Marinactinospora rubrisoli TaxID=2715399 RepID=A0ABW2KDN9_9ACTN